MFESPLDHRLDEEQLERIVCIFAETLSVLCERSGDPHQVPPQEHKLQQEIHEHLLLTVWDELCELYIESPQRIFCFQVEVCQQLSCISNSKCPARQHFCM